MRVCVSLMIVCAWATAVVSGYDYELFGDTLIKKTDSLSHGESNGGNEKYSYKVFDVEFKRVETPFIIGIWIFFASLAKIGFHMTPKLSLIFPESCLLIVVGVVIGLLLFLTSSLHVSTMTPDVFFLYMLPPIILDAGYFMPNRLFFDHLGTILMFAVVGTIFNTLTIGASLWLVGQSGLFGCETPLLEMFLFSALISAVDPVAVLAVFEEIHVNEILYIVVFGESLLNDAVTVVLYHMFEAYTAMGPNNIFYTDILSGFASFFVVAVGGTVIGVGWGFLTGLVTRFTHQVRVIEPIFIFVMAYLAYLNAEIFHMSGILAITFCGITMKNYVEANISHKSHTTVKYAMKMLSSSSETIIFMFLGVATVNDSHDWNTWFVILTIAFCSFFRALGVIILTAVVNRFRLYKLNKVDKFVMSYGGLRGAVAFALVLLIDPHHIKLQPMFVTTTIAVIYFTVFFQGITIKPLVKILNVKRAEKRKPTMNERIHERIMDHTMAGVEDILGHHGNHHLRDSAQDVNKNLLVQGRQSLCRALHHSFIITLGSLRKFKRFDNRFIRPYLLRDHQGAEPKILETYSKLAMKDALDFMRRNASTIGNISNTESMSAIFRNYTAGNLNGRYTQNMTVPSFSQLDSSTWNIDLQELEYNPSKKDLTDARIHHLLAEELCQPCRRHRRLSYSRHTVDDRDLSTQVNYRMQMNTRRLVGDQRKHHHKRSKRLNKDGKQNHVSFPGIQQNGSAKQFANDYIDEVLQECETETRKTGPKEDWESGITFTAQPSPSEVEAPSPSFSLLNQITSLPGFKQVTKARLVTEYAKPRPTSLELADVPTIAEVTLPWRRDDKHAKNRRNHVSKRWWMCGLYEGIQPPSSPQKKNSKDSSGEVPRVSTPTALEKMLPWKRDDEGESTFPVRQNEFPGWCSNKEYLAYSSPSATFLGGIEQPGITSVIGLFRRESEPPSVSSSPQSSVLLIEEATSLLSPHSKTNGRRGSMLELASSVDPIPEEELMTGTKKVSGDGSTPSLNDRWSNSQSLTQLHQLSPSVESLESTDSENELDKLAKNNE